MTIAALLAITVAAEGLLAQVQTAQTKSVSNTLQLTSSAFGPGAPIPDQYACKGADQSPEFRWSGAPQVSMTFAMVMHDPDAPVGDWVHWVAWNIPSGEHALAADFPKDSELSNGTRQGRNSFGKIGYNGPCPPPGKPHRYFFRIYAVDAKLDLGSGTTRGQLDAALKGHILAEAEYMGIYRR
jgi:Raf kinase inhibitor-like YbhB/YbcL family protein